MKGWAWAFVLLAGCAELPETGAAAPVEPSQLEAELAEADWHWAYYTAALGGDRDTWLSFDGAGGVTETETVQSWVYDGDGESSYPVTRRVGTYTVDEAARVSLSYGAGKRVYFTAHVAPDAPEMSWSDGQQVFKTRDAAMTTRALRSLGDNRWGCSFGDQDAETGRDITVTVTVDPSASVCVMDILVALEVRKPEGAAAAEVTYPGVPCRVVELDFGRAIVADDLLTSDGRGGLITEGPPIDEGLYYPIMYAIQPVLFQVNTSPGVLLPNANNFDEEAWWAPRALPGSGGD